jgi:hypothetical protein
MVLDGSQLCPGGETDMGYQVGIEPSFSFFMYGYRLMVTSKSTFHSVA